VDGFQGRGGEFRRPFPLGVGVQPVVRTRQEASQSGLVQRRNAERICRECVSREGVNGELCSPAGLHESLDNDYV
jgi:hypothetical protein